MLAVVESIQYGSQATQESLEIQRQIAKIGASIHTPRDETYTYASLKSLAKQKIANLADDWWRLHRPHRYKELNISFVQQSKEIYLSRRILGRLIASRTGHGVFEVYHSQFSHPETSKYVCGAVKSPEHFFFCRRSRRAARKANESRPTHEAINWFLGTSDGARAFALIMVEEI
ncbi:hypothetical protein EV44_g3846 [Erysiphe necator]|uniref:Uncharacterized protein n=1 Tax=Uncinula necator TaxID=52586 RepID=A0A0B1P319_UNCNE|nr:hypothetical protein EV44_g3846 [Erysiphe necator]